MAKVRQQTLTLERFRLLIETDVVAESPLYTGKAKCIFIIIKGKLLNFPYLIIQGFQKSE